MMAQWKLGEGSSYATLVGFTWPTDQNPSSMQITSSAKMKKIDVDLREYTMNLDMGLKMAELTCEGFFTNESDYNALRKQALKGRVFINNGKEEVDMYYEQKLYAGSQDWFYYVRRGMVRGNRTGRKPRIYFYQAQFILTDAYRYDDTEKTDSSSGSSGSVSISVGGDVFNLPTFEFTASSSTNQINITGPSGSINITGLGLAAGEKVEIIQRLDTAFIYDSSGNITKTDKSYGGRIAVQNGSTASFSWSCDGSGTFKVKLRDRYL